MVAQDQGTGKEPGEAVVIDELNILNFQSHEKSRLVFSPGVNVIVGESDSGKSAVIRAVRWVLENRPMGDGFRSRWGGETDVEIILSGDAPAVSRVKGKDRNSYFIGDRELKKVQGDVPDEVGKLLNIPALGLGLQKDSFYLVNMNPGERARKFSEAAGLDVIHAAIKAVNGMYRSDKADRDLSEKQRDEYAAQEIGLAWVPDADSDLIELETLAEAIGEDREAVNGVQSILAMLETLDLEAGVLAWYLDALPLVESLEKASQDIKGIGGSVYNLKAVLGYLDALEGESEGLGWCINAESGVDAVLRTGGEAQDLARQASRLRGLVIELENQDADREVLAVDLAEMETTLAGELGDACPLCEQPIRGIE